MKIQTTALLILVMCVIAPLHLAAQTTVTYSVPVLPFPPPADTEIPLTGTDNWFYSGCVPPPVPSSGSEPVVGFFGLYAPLWWLNYSPAGSYGYVFSIPASMKNALTLVNGVSQGQGTTTQTLTIGGSSATYTLTISGHTVTEQLVWTDQETDNGFYINTINYNNTFNSIYDIETGIQTYSFNYNNTSILIATDGCTSNTTVMESGSLTYDYYTGMVVQPSMPPTTVQGLGPTGPNNPQSCCGDPISTGSGNYYHSNVDISVVDHIPNLPILFQRSYNSQDNFSGPLGNNWTHNFNVMLLTSSAGATVKWGDGHGEVYTLTNGMYVPAPGVTNALALNSSNNQYTLTRKDGVAYLFSSSGSLISITNPNGLSLGTVRDANSNLTQILCTGCTGSASLSLTYGQSNLISSVADSTGRKVSYAYDTNSNLISETDPLGNVTKYAYDSSNRLISVTLPNGSIQLQNTYDSMNRVISQTNALGNTITLAYNTPQQGQTTITDPLGHSTVHTYDTSMRIVTITDALGNTTSYSYDSNNNVATITDARGNIRNFTYDLFRNVLASEDPLGNTSSYTYNSFSEPLTIKTPNGNTTTLTYDAKGNLTTVQDALGNQSSFSYNGFGQVISAKDAKGNTKSFSYNSSTLCLIGTVDALGNQTSLTCDAIGRLTSVIDPNKHTSTIAYDLLNRITSLTDALGDQTSFGHDSVGNLVSITDANQHATAYGYDGVGNLIQVTDALAHNTTYAYDKNNNRVSFTNANGKVTNYAYDSDNRLVLITDPLSFSTSYALDRVGNVTGLTDANGKQNTFSYDADNRLTNVSYSDDTAVAYTYDPDGNRTTMVDPHGTTSYSYDALDLVLSVVFPGANTVQYGYDPVGNRSSLTYPDKSVVTFAHDADNRLSGVTDWQKRNTSYSYDPASNLVGIAFPNTTTATLAYDAANRLTGITDSAKSAYRTFRYTLDKVGNRTAIFDTIATTNYTYDAVNELLTAQLGPLKESWTYDPVGNRTSENVLGIPINYTYDADNRMLTTGPIQLTYDNNGNRLTYGLIKYAYDANNRLLSVAAHGGTSTFAYDGDGNRVGQTTPAGTYNYVNDTVAPLPVVLNEAGPNGNIDYAYGQGLTESSSSAFNYFYSLDGLGSVSNLTDATGKVQGTYSYGPWGNPLITIGGTKNEFRFTGQALDPTTGLYFMRARYYDPTSGHFLTKDPLAGDARFPVTLNRYPYAANNPLKFIDPSGRQNNVTTVPPFNGTLTVPPNWPPPNPDQCTLANPNGEPYNPGPEIGPPPPGEENPCFPFINAEGECEAPEPGEPWEPPPLPVRPFTPQPVLPPPVPID